MKVEPANCCSTQFYIDAHVIKAVGTVVFLGGVRVWWGWVGFRVLLGVKRVGVFGYPKYEGRSISSETGPAISTIFMILTCASQDFTL